MSEIALGIGQVEGVRMIRVLGYGPKVGTGTMYSYVTYVERGLGYSAWKFASQVEAILGDARSWIRSGKVAFQRVPKGGNTRLILASPETTDRLCIPLKTEGYADCCIDGKVVINYDRWTKGVEHWTGQLKTYRQMLINHEFGHRIGQNHRTCPGPGKLAPCMQQQTYGLQGCKANSWPLASEL